MIRSLSLALMLVTLVACDQSATASKNPLTMKLGLAVHWATSDEIARVAHDYGDATADRDGYAVLKGVGGAWTCDIYAHEPFVLNAAAQELLGHELLHCLYGNYHAEP